MRFALIFLFSLNAIALEIPKGLTKSDRTEMVRILGLNSATKILSNPYPLGGYSGLEVGYSLEFVNVRDMRRLGCAPGSLGCLNTNLPEETEWRYSRLTVGKGLYSDVDAFFSFMPPVGGVNVSGRLCTVAVACGDLTLKDSSAFVRSIFSIVIGFLPRMMTFIVLV